MHPLFRNWRPHYLTRVIGLSLLLISFQCYPTHLKSIQIQLTKTGSCDGASFGITVRFYLNNNPLETGTHAGGGILNFGDGNSIELPELATTNRPELGPNIG